MSEAPTMGRAIPIVESLAPSVQEESGHQPSDTQGRRAASSRTLILNETPATDRAKPMADSPAPPIQESGHPPGETQSGIAASWVGLRITAEQFEDLQRARIGMTNRAERGEIDPTLYAEVLIHINAAERTLGLLMHRQYRTTVPPAVRAFQAETVGLGEHTFARLLGLLGHPRQAQPWRWEGNGEDRRLAPDPPYMRSVGQLWSLCGVGDPARKRRRGMSAEEGAALGSPRIKSLMYVVAVGCIKQAGSPYELVYRRARAEYADRVHAEPCVRCGPSGKPAPTGSPWSKAHQHAAALRKVAKEILRDLYSVAGE